MTTPVRTPDEWPSFRFGIMEVLDALCNSEPPIPTAEVAGKLRQHLWEVGRRFVFSLQHLNRLLDMMSVSMSRIPFAPDYSHLALNAGCHGDHALSYLGMIVDDIAQAIIVAVGLEPDTNMESMGNLVSRKARKRQEFDPVRTLLEELDVVGSWWNLGFKRAVGARQRVIHNHYVVSFMSSTSPGETTRAVALLTYRGGSHEVEFIELLRHICQGLCEWLDRLEDALLQHIRSTGRTWLSAGRCHTIPLGLDWSQEGVTFRRQYFPLPICDGADPLPWTIVPLQVRYADDTGT